MGRFKLRGLGHCIEEFPDFGVAGSYCKLLNRVDIVRKFLGESSGCGLECGMVAG